MPDDRDELMSTHAAAYGEELAALGPVGIVRTTAGANVALRVPCPRNEKNVAIAVRREAEAMRGDAIYAFPVRSKDGRTTTIEGPSVKLAMAMYRRWGNATLDLALVKESRDAFWVLATFIDYETGASFPSLFRQRRTTATGEKKGRFDPDRLDDIDLQIASAKATRNAILRGMPAYLVSMAVAAAKKSAARAFSPEERRRMVDAWGRLGVSVDDLEARLGVAIGSVGPEAWEELRSVYAAIRDGYTTVEAEFPTESARPAAAPAETEPAPAEPEPEDYDPETGEVIEAEPGEEPPASEPVEKPEAEPEPPEEPPPPEPAPPEHPEEAEPQGGEPGDPYTDPPAPPPPLTAAEEAAAARLRGGPRPKRGARSRGDREPGEEG